MASSDPNSKDEQLNALSVELRRLARRLESGHVSGDDLVQDAWFAALSSSPERIGDLRAWLKATIRNLARRAARRSELREASERRAAQSEGSELREDDLERREELEALRAAVLELREPLRSVVVLRFFDGCSLEQVAERLGRPLETVRTQQRRALSKLRDAGWDKRRRRRTPLLALWMRRARSRPRVAAALAAVIVAASIALVLWARATRLAPPTDVELATAPRAIGDESSSVDEPSAERVVVDAPLRAPPTPVEAEPLVAFRFRVVTQEGEPAPHATLTANGARELGAEHFSADASGRCAIELPLARLSDITLVAGSRGSVGVSAHADGHARSLLHLVDSTVGSEEIELRLGGAEATLAGRVVDVDGVPIAGAQLELDRPEGSVIPLRAGVVCMHGLVSTRADDDGRFELRHITSGEHGYHASAAGFAPVRGRVRIESRAETMIVLDRGATIAGRVIDVDGAPAAGATIELAQTEALLAAAQTTSDEFGRFRLSGVEPGGRWVFARTARGWADAHLTTPERGELEWNPQLAATPPLVVRVVRQDASPVADAIVVVETAHPDHADWNAAAATQSDGRAAFERYPQAALRCNVFIDSSVQQVASTTFDPRALAYELVLSVGADADAPKARVTGCVLDSDGAPMRGAIVVAAALDNPGELRIPVAAESGRFASEVVLPGEHRWIAAGERGALDLGVHLAQPGGALELGQLRAGPTASMAVRWRAASGRGERWSLLWRVDAGSREARGWVCDLTRADADLELYPGKYQIDVQRPDGSRRCAYSFAIIAGQTLRVDLP